MCAIQTCVTQGATVERQIRLLMGESANNLEGSKK